MNKKIVLALAAMLAAPSALNAQALPKLCDDLPKNSFITRTRFLDEAHRALTSEIRHANEKVSDKQAAELRMRLRSRLEEQIRAARNNPVRAAILQVDLLQLSKLNISEDELSRIRRNVIEVLGRSSPTPAAAEALAIFVTSNLNFVPEAERLALLRAAVTGHRAHFGHDPRQTQLYLSAYDTASTDADKLVILRTFAESAANMAMPRPLFEAQIRLLKHLPRSEPEYHKIAEALAPKALAVAATPVTKKGSEGGVSCFSRFSEFAVEMTSALSVAAPDGDKRRFIKAAMLHLAASMNFETHAQFILEDLSLILAGRLVDFDAFLDAMARLETADPGCKPPSEPEVLCGLLASARLLFEMNRPTLGLSLLQDAAQLSIAQKAKANLTWRIRIALADAEWKHGQKSLAASAVANMDATEIKRVARLTDLGTFHRLRAEIGDAMLEPRIAGESFSALVDLALADERNPGNPDERDIGTIAFTLVQRQMRRHFCPDCGSEVSEPTERWIREGIKQRKLSPFMASERYLLQRRLTGSANARADASTFERALIESYKDEWKSLLANAKRRLPKGTTDANIIRVIAIAASLAGDSGVGFAGDSGLGSSARTIDTILKFIIERDDAKKSKIWKDEMWAQVFTGYAEEGITDRFQEVLDSFSRNLSAAGYYLDAGFVLKILTHETGLYAEPNKDLNTAQLIVAKGRAFFWTSVYARLASLAADRKEWKEANEYLDISQQIATARLDDEWNTSPDRIGLLLRELKPALRLAAQTRVIVNANSPQTERRAQKAFEELQLAMLGETAAGLQAAQRRRLTADPALAAAMEKRDRADARLALLQAYDDAVGVLDESARAEERKQVTQQRDEAGKLADTLLPVAESLASLKPITLAEAQKVLQPSEALLILHAGSDAIYGSLATKDGEPLVWRQPMQIADLDRRVQALRKGLEIDDRLPSFPMQEAHDLFRALLGPAQDRLGQFRSLLVVADGPLLSVPMGVLPTQMPISAPQTAEQFRTAGIKWLGLSHAIAYLPTARALESRLAQRLTRTSTLPFTGIGNPVLAQGQHASRSIDYASVFRRDSLANVDLLRTQISLPETEDEIRAVSKLLGGREQDLFLGDKASEPDIRKNGLGAYRIIMFATHGLMGGQLTGMAEPGLVLTPPAVATAENDGLLAASEIIGMKLDADLVILSACNTASSDGRPRAEGFSGLTRAFLSAGARNVIVTHWAIPSEPAVFVTTGMMEERQLDPTISWSEALRRSFATLIERKGRPEFAHPSNWAAFSVVGMQESGR